MFMVFILWRQFLKVRSTTEASAHKLMYEALRSIQFTEFIDYMNLSEDGTFNDQLQQLNICLQEIREVTIDKDHTGLSNKYNQHKTIIETFFTNIFK